MLGRLRGVHAVAAIGMLITVGVASCADDKPLFSDPGGAGGTAGEGGEGGDGGVGGIGGMGGMGGEGGVVLAPPLRNPVPDIEDSELAYQSLLLMGYAPLGSQVTTCSECHSLNRGRLEEWRNYTDTAVADCFADTTVPSVAAAEAVLECVRFKPNDSSPFSATKMGIYSAASHLDWFDFVFDRAHDGDGSTERDAFIQAVAMPKVPHEPMSQEDFDIVAEWFARGLPFMEDLLPPPPMPGDCIPNITNRVANHINEMATTGWKAENEANNLLMFGCAGAATALDCLDTYPLASSTAFGDTWEHMPGAKLRVLRTNSFASSFWARGSADGRYVGFGGGSNGGSTMVDLMTDSEIQLDAAYDPAFFPDNSAFMFQGTPGGTGICQQSLLGMSPTSIDFSEALCSTSAGIGLYQHVGATLGGGDYWAVDSAFVSDNGGHNTTLENPSANFDGSDDFDLTPMVFDGSNYIEKPEISIATPFEGDAVLSKSGQLVIGRVAGAGFKQHSFKLRELEAIPNGGTYTINSLLIAEYCFEGGKPDFSFDERYAILHRYVTDDDAVELGFTGAQDPNFQQYRSQGAANIYILDLLTGITRRVTSMKPGQYALFPHFRSDGWVYFIVRNRNNTEYIVASDAVLTLEN